MTKNLAKAEFVLGVASLVAEAIGRTELPTYQQMLGEIVDVVETLHAYLRGRGGGRRRRTSTATACRTRASWARRATTSRKAYPRLIEILQLIGSSGLMATPTERDLAAPELAADVEKYYQSATLMGPRPGAAVPAGLGPRLQLFAGRQVLYERFFAGDPYLAMAARFLGYDRGPATAASTPCWRARGELREPPPAP